MTHKFTCSLLACLALAGIARAQKGANSKPDETFTSSDRTFQFQYPASLVPCSRDAQHNLWIPSGSCDGYIPVCADGSGDSDATIACIAYRADEMKGTNFQAGAFSVNVLKQATASECLTIEESSTTQAGKARTETVNGTKFRVVETGDAAAGHLRSGYAYRSFHKGKCYELDINIASTNIGNYDPGTVKPFDSDKVESALKRVLGTFKFLQ